MQLVLCIICYEALRGKKLQGTSTRASTGGVGRTGPPAEIPRFLGTTNEGRSSMTRGCLGVGRYGPRLEGQGVMQQPLCRTYRYNVTVPRATTRTARFSIGRRCVR